MRRPLLLAASVLGSGLALGACYAPELRDCTVTRSASTDCADDQVCGTDRYCAAPDVAGTCESTGSGADKVTLRVTVQGRGKVTAVGIGECGALTEAGDDCTWQVAAGTQVMLIASDTKFERWSSACSGKELTCSFVSTSSAIVVAKFKSGGDDD